MADKLTDGELVERLRAVQEHGSRAKAALALGQKPSGFRASIQEAKARGLTADSAVSTPLDKANARVKLLEQELSKRQKAEDEAEAIRREIFKIAEHSPEPPEWLIKEGAAGSRGMPTYFNSDLHYGEVVQPSEVGGLNTFNSDVAAKRIKRGVEVACDLSFNHMGKAKTKYPGIVYALGGDLISGDIHEELSVSNDRTPQQCINDLSDILAACIETFASKFGRVFVPCVTGNHGRSTRKPRMKGRVYTSHEWNIYCNLARAFKREKRVQFLIPNNTDARWQIYNHRYLLTHGDNLGVKGGDGIIGALGPIRRGEIKIRNSEAQVNRDFDTIIMGHWHQYITIPGLIVNNSLKGYDEFARLALRAPWSRPSQALWFTHPEHGVTAHWQVYVDDPLPVVREQNETPVLSWRE